MESRLRMSRHTQLRISKTKITSAYDDNFQYHLIHHAVYPAGYKSPTGRRSPAPGNLDQVRHNLSASRASVLEPQCSESEFQDFKDTNMGLSLESDVMTQVIPGIEGKSKIPHWTNIEFTNLKSLTYEKTVAPKPDSYDGVLRQEIHPQVQIDLNSMIMPSRVRSKAPAAPNFFLQVKGEDGTWKVARRQVCLDGAMGARAMHSLQNYGEAEPTYDGNAYTYSAAYFDCVLEVYAHHITAPTPDSSGPEYHMTLLDVIPMHLSYEMYVKGVIAFRNARDMAKKHRDNFVKIANSRASQAEAGEERHRKSWAMQTSTTRTLSTAMSTPLWMVMVMVMGKVRTRRLDLSGNSARVQASRVMAPGRVGLVVEMREWLLMVFVMCMLSFWGDS
ncbi:hypothetical protein BGZ61DRAFT_457307 [Ilyonectria robusta]|uniref:uncharacterized protein n=1 Tax=Ilyonectria robusta TaxID=1079257 RepID=UPI001E8EB935|nr:uncharacterized protein BGZ61DRAFT_457307 [Ilyonectria robusta]KAH8676944.1 hypothetical protein BGZ61DRAFT_457307 [Ilyonectria robusta]